MKNKIIISCFIGIFILIIGLCVRAQVSENVPLTNQAKISTDVEMYTSDDEQLTVYEMDTEEYNKIDFRKKIKK